MRQEADQREERQIRQQASPRMPSAQLSPSGCSSFARLASGAVCQSVTVASEPVPACNPERTATLPQAQMPFVPPLNIVAPWGAGSTEAQSLLEAGLIRSHHRVPHDPDDEEGLTVETPGGETSAPKSIRDGVASHFPATARLQDAVESMVDAMVFFGNRLLTLWGALPGEVVGVFALLPILEPVSDLIVVNQLMSHSLYVSATLLLVVLMLNWRFCTIYAALAPTPSVRSFCAMYFPFALFANWSCLLGEEVGDSELEMVYAEAGVPVSPVKAPSRSRSVVALPAPRTLPAPSPPPSPPLGRADHRAHFTRLSIRTGRSVRQSAPHVALESKNPRYGLEAARLRSLLERNYETWRTQRNLYEKMVFLVSFEARILGLSVVLGPFLLWRAALTIAHGLAFPTAGEDSPRYMDPKAEEMAHKQLLYSRILTFVEAIGESFPQLLLQGSVFYMFAGSIHVNVFAFSAACSLGVIAMALISFAENRKEVMDLLDPPLSAFVDRVDALCNAAQVDPAALLAAILAARAAGVPSGELKGAVLRLKQVRVAHVKQRKSTGSSAVELKSAGILTTELHDAGLSARGLKSEGYALEELQSVGYRVEELRKAGYTASQLHQVGHTLSELKSVGFAAAELRALEVYSAADLKAVGFEASDLKAVLYSAAELHQAGFSLKQLKQALFTLVELQSAGFSAADLKAVGFTAGELKATQCSTIELKQAGFKLQEIHAAGYGLAHLKAANYTPKELRTVGYAAADMMSEGFTALELRNAGYSVMELRAAGYPTLELKHAGFTVPQLTGAGFGAPEMRDGGFTVPDLKSVYTPAELRAAGFTAEEMRTGGITSVAILKLAGYTATEIKQAGYNAAQAKAAGFVLAELKVAGYTAKQMKPAGYVLGDLKAVGCSTTELRAAGFSATQLRTAGYSAADQKVAGYAARDLKEAGYTASDLKAGGFSAGELKAAGYTTAELRSAQYTAVQLKAAGYSAPQMKAAGYSLKQLKIAGYVLSELKTARYTAAELKFSGYTMEELKTAGFLAAEMKLALYSANQLTGAGYTLSELKVAGYDSTELKVSGYSAAELTVAGYSVTQLKQSGYDAQACKAAGYSAAELRSAGFTLQQLKAADYTHQELMTAGFSAAALRVLQNTLAVSGSNASTRRNSNSSLPSDRGAEHGAIVPVNTKRG